MKHLIIGLVLVSMLSSVYTHIVDEQKKGEAARQKIVNDCYKEKSLKREHFESNLDYLTHESKVLRECRGKVL